MLRQQIGATQEEFAHLIGVTTSTVSRWETYKSRPSKIARRALMAISKSADNSPAVETKMTSNGTSLFAKSHRQAAAMKETDL